MFLGRLERVGVQLNGVRRPAAVVRVHADVESQPGGQAAHGERRFVRSHVAGQRLSVTIVNLHYEFLAQATVEAGFTPDYQRRGRLVHHRTVFQAVRTP